MTQLLLSVILGVVIIVITWRVIGRLVRNPVWLRAPLRLGAMVGIVALGVVFAPRLALPVAEQVGTAGTPSPQDQTPTDTTVVEQASLTVTLNATGSIAPVDQVELAFELSAPVIEVLVSEGQRVQAGDVLARLEPTDFEAIVRDAEIALAQAQATYDDLTRPPRDVDVAVAQAQVILAQASLYAASLTAPDATDEEIVRLQAELARNQLWQTQLSRDIQLFPAPEFRDRGGGANAQEVNLNSQVQAQEYNVEIADTAYNDTLSDGPDAGALSGANAALVQAQANLDNLLNPATEAELRRAEIDVETARLGLQRAREQLAKTTLIAPIDGLIADEELTVGEVPPRSDVITMIDDSHYTIDLAIDETDIVNVSVGQRVELQVDALPDVDFTGTVTKVDSAPTIEGQLVTYKASVTLNPSTAPLRPGMSATATIITSELENVLIVPNRFIRVDNETQRAYVTVEDNGQYREVEVQIGARNDTDSEILGGVEAGQTIALLPRQTTLPQSSGGPFGGSQGGS